MFFFSLIIHYLRQYLRVLIRVLQIRKFDSIDCSVGTNPIRESNCM